MSTEPQSCGREKDRPPAFDFQAAVERLGNDLSLFADLAELFQTDSPPVLAALRAALAAGDARQAERAAHTLKGMAANFDARRAVAAAARIEQLAKAAALATATRELPVLETELARLTTALQDHLRRPNP